MKTIKRDPKWPEWAEYYAKDKNGCAYVYSCMPYRDEDPDQLDEWEYIGHVASAAENTHSKVTCRNWKSSLRKIEEVKEMNMKTIERDPNWPEWAKYYARDLDGRAYVYEAFPCKNQENTVWWCVSGSRMQYAGDWGLDVFKSCADWQNSVRKIASIDEKPVASAHHPAASSGTVSGTNWLQPSDIKKHPECHSTAMQIIPLLLAMEGEKYPVKGWYRVGLQVWRIDGSPSECTPIAWQPMPNMPNAVSTVASGTSKEMKGD